MWYSKSYDQRSRPRASNSSRYRWTSSNVNTNPNRTWRACHQPPGVSVPPVRTCGPVRHRFAASVRSRLKYVAPERPAPNAPTAPKQVRKCVTPLHPNPSTGPQQIRKDVAPPLRPPPPTNNQATSSKQVCMYISPKLVSDLLSKGFRMPSSSSLKALAKSASQPEPKRELATPSTATSSLRSTSLQRSTSSVSVKPAAAAAQPKIKNEAPKFAAPAACTPLRRYRSPKATAVTKNVSKNPYKVIRKNINSPTFPAGIKTSPKFKFAKYNYRNPSAGVVRSNILKPFLSPKFVKNSLYKYTTASYYSALKMNQRKERLRKVNNRNSGSSNKTILTKFKYVRSPTALKAKSPTATPATLKFTSLNQTQARQAVKRSLFRVKSSAAKKMKMTRTYCIYFNRFGKCKRGNKCPYTHDPRRVALCTRFLNGKCRSESCPFSHEITKSKVPVCNFYLRGVCNVENCKYLHVYHGSDAKICRQFAHTGFCPRADSCKEQHMRVCPDFYENETCRKGEKCPLPHKRNPKAQKKIIAEKKRALKE